MDLGLDPNTLKEKKDKEMQIFFFFLLKKGASRF